MSNVTSSESRCSEWDQDNPTESYDTETGPSAMNLFSTPKSRFVFIKQRLLPIVQTSARLECPPPHLGLKGKLESRHLRFSAPLWGHSIWNIHQSHITQMDISEAKHNIYINSSAELKDQPHSLWGGTVCSTLQSWHWMKSKAYFKLCSGGIWALASCHWLLLLKRSPFKKNALLQGDTFFRSRTGVAKWLPSRTTRHTEEPLYSRGTP